MFLNYNSGWATTMSFINQVLKVFWSAKSTAYSIHVCDLYQHLSKLLHKEKRRKTEKKIIHILISIMFLFCVEENNTYI